MNDNWWWVRVQFWYVVSLLVVHKMKLWLETEGLLDTTKYNDLTAWCTRNCPWCWPGAEGWAFLGQRWQLTGGEISEKQGNSTHLFLKHNSFPQAYWCLKFHLPRQDKNSHLLSSQSLWEALNIHYFIESLQPLLSSLSKEKADGRRLMNLPRWQCC